MQLLACKLNLPLGKVLFKTSKSLFLPSHTVLSLLGHLLGEGSRWLSQKHVCANGSVEQLVEEQLLLPAVSGLVSPQSEGSWDRL